MEPQSLRSLVEAYVERYAKRFQWNKDLVLREQDLNFWAYQEFERLLKGSPDDAWEAILAVSAATADEFTLANLAAGPLEDLIQGHGEMFIDRIEERAALDPVFKELLSGVWQGSTPSIVWGRIERARGNIDAADA